MRARGAFAFALRTFRRLLRALAPPPELVVDGSISVRTQLDSRASRNASTSREASHTPYPTDVDGRRPDDPARLRPGLPRERAPDDDPLAGDATETAGERPRRRRRRATRADAARRPSLLARGARPVPPRNPRSRRRVARAAESNRGRSRRGRGARRSLAPSREPVANTGPPLVLVPQKQVVVVVVGARLSRSRGGFPRRATSASAVERRPRRLDPRRRRLGSLSRSRLVVPSSSDVVAGPEPSRRRTRSRAERPRAPPVPLRALVHEHRHRRLPVRPHLRPRPRPVPAPQRRAEGQPRAPRAELAARASRLQERGGVLCSVRTTAAYDAPHRDRPPIPRARRARFPTTRLRSPGRRSLGDGAAQLASVASSPLVIVRSGAHRRRKSLVQRRGLFGPGASTAGPLGAYTTRASSSCTLARRARVAISAVTAAFINISRTDVLRTSLGAWHSCALTTTPSKDLSREPPRRARSREFSRRQSSGEAPQVPFANASSCGMSSPGYPPRSAVGARETAPSRRAVSRCCGTCAVAAWVYTPCTSSTTDTLLSTTPMRSLFGSKHGSGPEDGAQRTGWRRRADGGVARGQRRRRDSSRLVALGVGRAARCPRCARGAPSRGRRRGWPRRGVRSGESARVRRPDGPARGAASLVVGGIVATLFGHRHRGRILPAHGRPPDVLRGRPTPPSAAGAWRRTRRGRRPPTCGAPTPSTALRRLGVTNGHP